MNAEFLDTDNLFLIGYRCTGKSSVGNLLAAALRRMFVDTDSLVASQEGMSIREIDLNRQYFRNRRNPGKTNSTLQKCDGFFGGYGPS